MLLINILTSIRHNIYNLVLGKGFNQNEAKDHPGTELHNSYSSRDTAIWNLKRMSARGIKWRGQKVPSLLPTLYFRHPCSDHAHLGTFL